MTQSEEEMVVNEKPVCVRQSSYHEAVARDEVGLSNGSDNLLQETKESEKTRRAT